MHANCAARTSCNTDCEIVCKLPQITIHLVNFYATNFKKKKLWGMHTEHIIKFEWRGPGPLVIAVLDLQVRGAEGAENLTLLNDF